MTSPALRDRLGRPLADLRISVIDRCNYRCPYCMPIERFGGPSVFLKRNELLDNAATVRIATAFAALGVRKLRLTGGEPLLRADLPELVRALSAIPGIEDIALTTNGELLADRAQALADAGLKRITVSLDALDPEVFRRMSGGFGDVTRVLSGIEAAVRAGLAPVKLNCTVVRGQNEDEILPLVSRFRGQGITVRFIEYMDVGTCNRWQMAAVVPSREVHAAIHARWPLQPVQPAYRGEVAERYRFADGAGEIGFISSVSQPFCGDCTRARLSADGQLYTCLFGRSGRDLRTPLRGGASDEELRALVAAVWRARRDRYSEQRQDNEAAREGRVEMYRIGG